MSDSYCLQYVNQFRMDGLNPILKQARGVGFAQLYIKALTILLVLDSLVINIFCC